MLIVLHLLLDRCPKSHPYAYYDGKYCCSSGYQTWAPTYTKGKCDNLKIGLDSVCCKGENIPCPGGICRNSGKILSKE